MADEALSLWLTMPCHWWRHRMNPGSWVMQDELLDPGSWIWVTQDEILN